MIMKLKLYDFCGLSINENQVKKFSKKLIEIDLLKLNFLIIVDFKNNIDVCFYNINFIDGNYVQAINMLKNKAFMVAPSGPGLSKIIKIISIEKHFK